MLVKTVTLLSQSICTIIKEDGQWSHICTGGLIPFLQVTAEGIVVRIETSRKKIMKKRHCSLSSTSEKSVSSPESNGQISPVASR